jgi:hypothetical protein
MISADCFQIDRTADIIVIHAGHWFVCTVIVKGIALLMAVPADALIKTSLWIRAVDIALNQRLSLLFRDPCSANNVGKDARTPCVLRERRGATISTFPSICARCPVFDVN